MRRACLTACWRRFSPALMAGSFSRKLRYGVEAFGFFLLMGFLALFDVDTASSIGGWLGRNIFSKLSPNNTAYKNLKAAFPAKSEAEIQAILTAMWDNLGRVVGEYPHLSAFNKVGPGARIEVKGEAHVMEAAQGGRGTMFL